MQKGLSFKSHPSEDLLEEYAFQRLADEQVAPLEEHLLVCSNCQEALAEIDGYLRLMKRGLAQTAVSPAHGWRTSWWPRWMPDRPPAFATKWADSWTWTAAGAVACLAVAIFLSHWSAEVPIGPVPIALVSLRGAETITAPHGAPLELQLDADSPSPADYRIEIVTAAGKRVWNGASQPRNGKLEANVTPGLAKGLYWVRLYESEKLRSETGLLVR